MYSFVSFVFFDFFGFVFLIFELYFWFGCLGSLWVLELFGIVWFVGIYLDLFVCDLFFDVSGIFGFGSFGCVFWFTLIFWISYDVLDLFVFFWIFGICGFLYLELFGIFWCGLCFFIFELGVLCKCGDTALWRKM